MARRDQEFQSIRSEGGLLPMDLLRRVLDPRASLAGTKPEVPTVDTAATNKEAA